jgi:ABC-type polysaccharide/polyol phosphate export permease
VVLFVSRSLKMRYKRSSLGVLWTLLNPLLTMLVLTLVFSSVFRFSIPHYPVYLLNALVVWNFFNYTTNQGMIDMSFNSGLLRRIYVPRSVFVISATGTAVINLLVSLIPLFAIALITGVAFTPSLLVLPFAFVLLILFSLGLALILSAAAVFFGDVVPLYTVLLTIWMYATPIFYPMDIIPPQYQWVFQLNPLYYLIEIVRAPIVSGTIPSMQIWVIAALFAVITLVAGWFIFTSKSNEYAYRA